MKDSFVACRVRDEIARLQREAEKMEDSNKRLFLMGELNALNWVRGLMEDESDL